MKSFYVTYVLVFALILIHSVDFNVQLLVDSCFVLITIQFFEQTKIIS